MTNIVLFDGKCNLCSSSVQFIINRDKKGFFRFASLQSEEGKALLSRYRIPANVDSIVVIDQKKEKYYLQSSAALQISKHLDGKWKLFAVLRIIPSPLRDIAYRYIARNRYKWFGKKDACMLPTPDRRSRFLDND